MWDYRSTDDMDDDWRDQIILRTCHACGESVRVSIHEPYAVQVWCDECLRQPARGSVARGQGATTPRTGSTASSNGR